MDSSLEPVLAALKAIAEPTRLRIVALCGSSEWCVSDLVEILGQSQPRLSRHLKLLCEAGILARFPEGPSVQFRLSTQLPAAALAAATLAQLSDADPVLAADRRRAAARRADRARAASEAFRRLGSEWDEIAALGLDGPAIEAALLDLLPPGPLGRLLDIGAGTGRLVEVLAPRLSTAVGVDLSREMLAVARARFAERGLLHCTARHADMARLPFPDASFDLVTLQMVLHYAEDATAVLGEAIRTLAPGGRIVVIDLLRHDDPGLLQRHAHRVPGFELDAISRILQRLGLSGGAARTIPGPKQVSLWSAHRPAASRAPDPARSQPISA